MKKTYHISNNFHGTKTTVRAEMVQGHLRLTESQARRTKSILCGCKGCTCSGASGARGPQNFDGEIF